MSQKRYMENTFTAYNENENLLDVEDKLDPQYSTVIHNFITEHETFLEDFITNRKFDHRDYSIYTGYSGIILYLMKIREEKSCYRKIIFDVLNKLKGRRLTYLCGDAGPLCLALQLCDDEKERKEFCKELLNLKCLKENVPTEVLYGLSGYLYALLFVRKHFGEQLMSDGNIKEVVQLIINRGLTDQEKYGGDLLLYYAWHEKQYLGAAHGYTGILYMLLQAKLICPDCMTQRQFEIIFECIDKLQTEQIFPSGNMRSSIGSERDRLVQWCHGAPGAVHLYALAYKITNRSTYLLTLTKLADVVWQRGLLTKSIGLCHGTAGNGYVFLTMFQLTKDKLYLWKTVKFAEWCIRKDLSYRQPDRPLSLFEGEYDENEYLNEINRDTFSRMTQFQIFHRDKFSRMQVDKVKEFAAETNVTLLKITFVYAL